MNFTGAGCLFFNDQFFLAGYQPRKQKPCISGLGGKREGEEDLFTAALRETIEELFELQTVPVEWIQSIQQRIQHRGVVKNGDYFSVLYSFDDLQEILCFLDSQHCVSPLYEEFPLHLLSLLFNRKQVSPPPEISHLLLLPLVLHATEHHFVSPYFLKDIRMLLQQKLFIEPGSSVLPE